MKSLIVEDEQPAVKVLQHHLQHFPLIQLVSVCRNAFDALAILQQTKIDLLFLDVQLPKMSGIQLLSTIPPGPSVILTTAFREFALQGYELEIVDYLVKPISFERFVKAIGRVYKLQAKPFEYAHTTPRDVMSAPFIYVKVDREYQRILLNELLYIESLKNHSKLVTTKMTYFTLMGISELELKLPPNFLRIHRSFVVSTDAIEKFTQSYVTIGSTTIPIGSHYKVLFQKWVFRKV